MGKDVFANGMEVAHKAGDAQVIAAFPDVCLSPPPPPTGPVPVPYPNTSFARDLRKGSKSVVIAGKPAALSGQSFYKSSPLGNEPATRNFGGAVITHTITGKTYFQASSMDVTFEGKTVCRHLDLTTSNHASEPGSTAPMPSTEKMAILTLADKKDAQWGHKRGESRHPCGGKHTWECGKAECPDCWDPPCKPNADETQANYTAQQTGTPEERAAKGKAANQRKFDDHGDLGAAFENKLIDAVGHAQIEHVGYKAHCSKCHITADLDVVTRDYVIEAKLSAGLAKKKQMEQRVIPVAKQCFPKKQVVIATDKGEVDALKKTLSEKEWSSLAIQALGV